MCDAVKDARREFNGQTRPSTVAHHFCATIASPNIKIVFVYKQFIIVHNATLKFTPLLKQIMLSRVGEPVLIQKQKSLLLCLTQNFN